MPLRICILGKYYPPASGGIETHVRSLARSQARLGATVRVIVSNHRNPAGEDVTWDVFARTPTVTEMDGPVEIVRVGRVASLARFDVCPDLVRALRQAKRDGFQVLHVHGPNPTMILALALLKPAIPIVITHHADVTRQKLLKHLLTPFDRLVASRSAVLFSDSPPYIDGSALLSRFRHKVESLPLGIDTTPFRNPSPEALGWARKYREDFGEPLWLGVGRLIYYKGFEVAIRAVVDVPGKLVIIGTGPLKESLQQLARSLGVESRVIFRGYAGGDELIGAYHAATAFWFPSVNRGEAYGLVQVEAMASGCPIINTSIPDSGVAWVSPHEVSGLTVPVGDAEALAHAARRILEEPGLRQRLAEQGIARASSEFEEEAMARQSLELYSRYIPSLKQR